MSLICCDLARFRDPEDHPGPSARDGRRFRRPASDVGECDPSGGGDRPLNAEYARIERDVAMRHARGAMTQVERVRAVHDALAWQRVRMRFVLRSALRRETSNVEVTA